MRKAVFLDRDGVINLDTGYVHRSEDFQFLDGVFDFCREMQRQGFLLIVITNQSGIARGYFTEADFSRLTSYMIRCFSDQGISIDAVFHSPDLSGPNRKPSPGLFLKARDQFDIDMESSINIGDKERDLIAGRAANVGTNILFTGSWLELPPCETRLRQLSL